MPFDIATNRSICIILKTVICLAVASSPAGAGDRTSKDRMLTEYPAALRRLEEQYARETGKAVFSSTAKKTGEKLTAEIQFACDSGLSRSIETRRGEGPDGYRERVRCSNPSYSFGLSRNSPDRSYTIRDVTEETRRVGEFGRYYFDGFMAAPYMAFGRPIREIMERPDLEFKLGDVSEVTHEGRRLLRISFEFHHAPTLPMTPAWIEVDPEFGWALRRYEGLFGKNRNVPRTASVEYSAMERGRPVIKRVVHSNATDDETFDIAEIHFDRHPAARDFTLSAFGLPEVNEKPVPSGSIPLNYWLFGFGAFALGLSIFIRLAHRKRTASSLGKAV